MNEIFGTIVNMSITASFLIAACLVIRKVFKHMPKYIRCLMWILVAIRLAVPFTIESPASLLPAKEYVPQETVVKESGNTETTLNTEKFVVVQNKAADASAEVPISADKKESAEGFDLDLMAILSAIWMLGFATVFIYAFISYIRLAKCVRNSSRVARDVYEVNCLESAFVLGIVRPRIYIPAGLTNDEAYIILSHERAHIKRLDHLLKPAAYLIAGMHWFNPLVWVFYYFLSEDIELACDEKAIKTIGYDKKKLYSVTLLNMSVPRKYIAACPVAFGETGTKERIRNVLKMKKNRTIAALAAFAVCAALTAGFLTYPEKAAADETKATADETVAESKEAYEELPAAEEVQAPKEATEAPEETENSEYVIIEDGPDAEVSEPEESEENAYGYEVPEEAINEDGTEVYSEGIWPVASEASFITRGCSDDHQGVDIVADEGTGIVATASGTVRYAAFDTKAGNYIEIAGDDGNTYRFNHLEDYDVSEGDKVSAGDIIGTIGSTGNSTGVHLHYAVFDASGNYVGF
ncbi:MAG: peptidoglycan DD-metalloendopeptidase family protein [Lachnospiraceae bacterium]|nr:peptidoglycan DD-metalloendopeptidase family protein [Lachnospiraceae bacterium]